MAAETAALSAATRLPPADMTWLSPAGVRARGDYVEWLPNESQRRRGVIQTSPGLLENFLALPDEPTAAQVADFAAEHGMLGVDEDGRAVLHLRWRRPRQYAREPVSAWAENIRQARSLMRAAQRLLEHRALTDAERLPVLRLAWPDVVADVYVGQLSDDEESALRLALLDHAGRTLSDDRRQLAWAVTGWLDSLGVRLTFMWPEGVSAPTLGLGGQTAGCLSAIAVQVALACCRAETTRACDGCGLLHAPTRQPAPGRRSFCEACRQAGVPVKIANRDRRARERETRETAHG